jgi:hypothetical protein
MIETKLEEWLNRAIQITLTPGIYDAERIIGHAQITIRFDQADIDEYLMFSDYIEEHYKDYEKIAEINQIADDNIQLKFTFNGDDMVEFGKPNVQCGNIRIRNWFDMQPRDKPIVLFPTINQTSDVLIELSAKDSENQASRSIIIHRWNGKPLGTSSTESTKV